METQLAEYKRHLASVRFTFDCHSLMTLRILRIALQRTASTGPQFDAILHEVNQAIIRKAAVRKCSK